MKRLIALALLLVVQPLLADSGIGWVSYKGTAAGPGKGKQVVLLAGDEEYRSEEALPMLAKILSERHGFDCTVLFSADDDGTINPNRGESLGKPEALDSADVIVMSLRFRKWPDETMKRFDAAIQRGIPVVGLRTSTHAFQLPDNSGFAQYNKFGKDVLGEEWVSHWGKHKGEACRGVIEAANASHPVLQGVSDVFGDSDVYEAYPPADATILLRGSVLKGMKPDDAPADHKKAGRNGQQGVNDPMMPIAWTREVKNTAGKTNKIVCTTMGAATDLKSEGLRRLVVNSVFWGLGLEVPKQADVTLVGDYQPSPFSFNGFKKGVKAADHAK
jgi:hypothetical protein